MRNMKSMRPLQWPSFYDYFYRARGHGALTPWIRYWLFLPDHTLLLDYLLRRNKQQWKELVEPQVYYFKEENKYICIFVKRTKHHAKHFTDSSRYRTVSVLCHLFLIITICSCFRSIFWIPMILCVTAKGDISQRKRQCKLRKYSAVKYNQVRNEMYSSDLAAEKLQQKCYCNKVWKTSRRKRSVYCYNKSKFQNIR